MPKKIRNRRPGQREFDLHNRSERPTSHRLLAPLEEEKAREELRLRKRRKSGNPKSGRAS